MTSNYAELVLYYGQCPNWAFGICNPKGISEGWFEGTENHSLTRWQEAMNVVSYFLNEKRDSIQIGQGLVKTHEEADYLLQYVQKNIPPAEAGIKLELCMQGKLTFDRTILFKEWTKKDKMNLIELLKKSGHVPEWNDSYTDYLIASLKKNEKKLKSFLKESGISLDQPWIEALRFYSH